MGHLINESNYYVIKIEKIRMLLLSVVLPWDYKLKSDNTLWNEMCIKYNVGVDSVRAMNKAWEEFRRIWKSAEILTKLLFLSKITHNCRIGALSHCHFTSLAHYPITSITTLPIFTTFVLKIYNFESKIRFYFWYPYHRRGNPLRQRN